VIKAGHPLYKEIVVGLDSASDVPGSVYVKEVPAGVAWSTGVVTKAGAVLAAGGGGGAGAV
jgi:hypothetical protein